jgi:hypothetical protein
LDQGRVLEPFPDAVLKGAWRPSAGAQILTVFADCMERYFWTELFDDI